MIVERGIIQAYDATTHKAAVQLFGSMSRILLDLPVAHHIGPELLDIGAACAVAFFAEGSQAVILATFDSAPDPWVTSALIKDGEIATADIADAQVTPAKLSFSPPTPGFYLKTTQTTQTLTLTPAIFQTLTQAITVPSGKTYNVFGIVTAEFGNTAYVGWNLDWVGLYADAAQVGLAHSKRQHAVSDRGTVTTGGAAAVSSTTTFSAKIFKSLNQNTEVAYRGTLTLLYWEATV